MTPTETLTRRYPRLRFTFSAVLLALLIAVGGFMLLTLPASAEPGTLAGVQSQLSNPDSPTDTCSYSFPNPGFESGFAYWTLGGDTLATLSTDARSGMYAALLQPESSPTEERTSVITRTFNFSSGSGTVRFWVRRSGSEGTVHSAIVKDSWGTHTVFSDTSNDSDWVPYDQYVMFGYGGTYFQVVLSVTIPPDGTGDMLVDDFEWLIYCPPSSTPTNTGTPPTSTPTITPTATRTPMPDCGLYGRAQSSPNAGTNTDALTGLVALAPNDIWAVGYSYDLSTSRYDNLIVHYDGTGWETVPSPRFGTEDNSLTAVSAVSSDDIWAVGVYGDYADPRTLTLHYTDGQWEIVPSPNIEGADNTLRGVSAISSDDVWAVGETVTWNGQTVVEPLTMHYSNGTWEMVELPSVGTGSVLYAVTALAPDDVWAVGYYSTNGTRTLTLHYDGAEWEVVSSPNSSPHFNSLHAVTAVSPDELWAVGGYGTTGMDRHTLTLHYTAGAWEVVLSPDGEGGSDLSGVAAVSSEEVWAVGTYETSGSEFRTLTLHYIGGQWERVLSDNMGDDSFLAGVAAPPGGDPWAVGSYSTPSTRTLILRYSDPCLTGTPVPATPTFIQTATSTPTQTPVDPSATPIAATVTAVATETVTACLIEFSDVSPNDTFYPYIRCLACRSILNGYEDGTFRPGIDVTRGQIAKIVSNSAGYDEDVDAQIYEDVDPTNIFYQWINRLSMRGHMGGYPCGTLNGEPCNSPDNRPYFRPFNNATRAQLAKIVSNAAGLGDTGAEQIFADVPPDNAFYVWIQRLASRGIMGGYACGGGESEPCDAEERPYFRPYNNVTRGQTSKIVAGAFFPGSCLSNSGQTP